jgi:hypothetical protein
VINAELLLRSLVGEALSTVRGRPNSVLSVANGQALVATSRSPQGQRVPVRWLQDVLDRLGAGETIPVEATSGAFRSAFMRAVLATLPQLEILETSPPRARLDPAANVNADVIAEFERRVAMWADLLDEGGPEDLSAAAVRSLGLYGGASGVWADATRTRGVGGEDSVAVAVMHTGRRYPDDLSEAALEYHYPSTDLRPGRANAESVLSRRPERSASPCS